ncbi:hypothetical protein [Chlorogloeopsis fritschii]|nr:hypothetical protein [Chlorogloeopsis fritschii]
MTTSLPQEFAVDTQSTKAKSRMIARKVGGNYPVHTSSIIILKID